MLLLYDHNLNEMERCYLKQQLLFLRLLIYQQIHHRDLLIFEDQQYQTELSHKILLLNLTINGSDLIIPSN